MNSSPSRGRNADQSSHEYNWKSLGSTTRAAPLNTFTSARATVETVIGCQFRFNTSVGRVIVSEAAVMTDLHQLFSIFDLRFLIGAAIENRKSKISQGVRRESNPYLGC